MDYEHEWKENTAPGWRLPEPEPAPESNHPLPTQDSRVHTEAMDYIRKRGINPGTAEFNQWYGSMEAGDQYPRVVIPASGQDGGQFWQARSLVKSDKIPRYQSPHGKRGSALVFCYPVESNPTPKVIVCEGPFDALAAADHGYVGIALMGVTPNREAIFHLRNVLHKYTPPIVFVADQDAVPEMVRLNQTIGVSAILQCAFPGFKDICDMDAIMRAEWFTVVDQKYQEVKDYLCE